MERAYVVFLRLGSNMHRHCILTIMIYVDIGLELFFFSSDPLDTMKVRMQTKSQQFPTLWSAIASTARTEGVRGFYRGLSTTIPGVACYNSLLFAAYGQFEVLSRRQSTVPSAPLSIAQIGWIGVCRRPGPRVKWGAWGPER